MSKTAAFFGAIVVITAAAFQASSSPQATTPTPDAGCACLSGGLCTCDDCRCGESSSILSALESLNERLEMIEAKQRVNEIAALVPDVSPPIESEPLLETPTLAADAQPTPYAVVFRAIDLLDLENTETLLDFGCGPDARVLTHAFHDTGCRGVGIEIDPRRATSASNLIGAAGLSPWIEIVEGDAITTPVEGNVGFAYLWSETLAELVPQIQKLDRFVSYAHAVPGLDMQRIEVPGYEPLWYWERAPEVSVTYTERPYAIYQGRRYYSDYNPGCNCSMCRTIRSQLASREHVEQVPTQAPPAQSAPRTTVATSTPTYSVSTQRSSSGCSSCANGQCNRPRRGRR